MEGLIADVDARAERASEKERLLLRFLSAEVYSRIDVLVHVLGIGRVATERALNRLRHQGLVTKEVIDVAFGKGISLWGITVAGFESLLDEDDVGKVRPRSFSARQVKVTNLAHTLAIQYARVYFEFRRYHIETGWIPDTVYWESSRDLPGQNATRASGKRWPAYPDAIFFECDDDYRGFSQAVEVELTKKTPSRYPSIIKNHWKNIEADRYYKVLYVLPTQSKAENLRLDFLKFMKAGVVGWESWENVWERFEFAYFTDDKVLQYVYEEEYDEEMDLEFQKWEASLNID
jgi:hypothetical protein